MEVPGEAGTDHDPVVSAGGTYWAGVDTAVFADLTVTSVTVSTFDPYRYEYIDWDPAEDDSGNLAHCMTHGVDERVVYEVVYEGPAVQISAPLRSGEFAVVGPDLAWSQMYTLILAESFKRGDWIRPVTGWGSKPSEKRSGGRLRG